MDIYFGAFIMTKFDENAVQPIVVGFEALARLSPEAACELHGRVMVALAAHLKRSAGLEKTRKYA